MYNISSRVIFMPEFLINGSIYIKIKPDITEKLVLNDGPYDTRIFGIDTVTGEKIYIKSNEDIKKIPKEPLKKLIELGEIKKVRKASNYEGIYRLIITDGKIYMINTLSKQAITYRNITELKDFVPLDEFLKKGVWIGRKFTNGTIVFELLYEYEGIFLLKKKGANEYIALPKHHEEIKGYQIGEFLEEYYLRDELFKSITSMGLDSGEERGR